MSEFNILKNRFIQTAEMLKPSSTSNLDQDYIEYYPHMLFLHNKAEVDDFTPNTLKIMTVITNCNIDLFFNITTNF